MGKISGRKGVQTNQRHYRSFNPNSRIMAICILGLGANSVELDDSTVRKNLQQLIWNRSSHTDFTNHMCPRCAQHSHEHFGIQHHEEILPQRQRRSHHSALRVPRRQRRQVQRLQEEQFLPLVHFCPFHVPGRQDLRFPGPPMYKSMGFHVSGSFFAAELLVIVPNRWLDITPQDKPGDNEIPLYSRQADDDQVPQGAQSASDKRIPLGTGGTSLPYLSITMSVLFILYFTVHAIISISETYNWRLNPLESIGMVLLVCGSPPFVSSSIRSYFLRTRRAGLNSSLEILLLLAILAVPTAYYLLPHVISLEQKDTSMLSPIATTVAVPVIIGTWAAISLAWASIITRGREAERRVEKALAWYFVLLNLVTTVLYYRFSYDPSGTVKPKWTEQLG
ncbi:hypothetical protein K505DRAFT_343231 [Melanomma pulvis-pyrius CBS 109.77]|uniref:Uncharacterized protein n=1 Tax=Melanomma pulvis-pyrius CBS 109.77 TaxID=1314802 RepID=A0A6A6WSH4_9PLEO|nr:hypothetical protein K505DRAFT_343231 [Melanomma pulvis-pyrius CBS 109.77]